MYKIRVRQEAQKDVKKGNLYYLKIRAQLGLDFELDIAKAFNSIGGFNKYEVKLYGMRIYNLKQFPYCLYYFVNEDLALVDIVAVLHKQAEFPVERLKDRV